MLEILTIAAALAASGYPLVKLVQSLNERANARSAIQQTRERAKAAARLRQAQAETTRRLAEAAKRQAAHDMQVAIQQLAQSPDFRRAASFAARAAEVRVPATFRQRQFCRLRPLLLDHLARRLQAGVGLQAAANGLRELIAALGVAAYEADYIATEAQACQTSPVERDPDYRERLRNSHAAHTRRLDAIRNTPDLDEELLEQLLEAEQERFRREVLEEPD